MPKIDRLGKISGLLLTVAVLSTIPSSAASATTIKLDLNGVAPVVHQVDSSGSVTVPEVKVEFDGMSFKGWNTSPTGNGKSYDEGDTINNSTTLYAQWADGTHIGGGTVDPDPGGGEEPGGGEDPDPDPGEDEEYAQLSDLNVITVTVDGKLLSSFNPLTNGTYTVPSGSNIRLNLNNLNLDVWSYTKSQPSSNTLTFTMTGKTQSDTNLVVTYTFKAEAEEPDPEPDPDPNPNPGGDEGEDPNPDDGNQGEGDNPGQDPNPDSDNDPNHDSNPTPGTITGDVSGGSNNGGSNNGGTGDTGRQDTALSPGSPTAGFINLTTLSNIKTAAPLAVIASGTLAVLAVLLLTNKEAKRVKQAKGNHHCLLTKLSSFITTFTHNKAYLTIASISALAILAGSFYLINTNTNAATDTYSEDWGIYVDDEGVPYEGFFTIMPEEGATDYSTAITTWWKGGQKQYGETKRYDAWAYFDQNNDGIMVRNKQIDHTAKTSLDITDPNNEVDHNATYTFRYGDDGKRFYGHYDKDGISQYYHDSFGIMLKGWVEVNNHSYHFDETTGNEHPFYERGQGGGELQTAYSLAQLAVRVAPTADGYSSPIYVNNQWDKVSNPEAQEYIRIMEEVTGQYDGDGTGNNTALASCTQAVGHIVRATVDPDIRMMGPNDMRNYLLNSPRWEHVTDVSYGSSLDSAGLQPGDILADVNDQHTALYLGNDIVRMAYPNSTANTYQAHYTTKQYPALETSSTAGYTFQVFRYKGKSGTTTHRYINVWRFLGGVGNWDMGKN